jgi:hypothetical protein
MVPRSVPSKSLSLAVLIDVKKTPVLLMQDTNSPFASKISTLPF